MRVVHAAKVPSDRRPDGREVTSLLDLPVNLPVDRTAVLLVEHPADFVEDRHCHQYLYEIFYFLDNADYEVNGERVRLRAGDLLLLEPNDMHGALSVPHPVRLIVFHVPKVPGDKLLAPPGT
ncbi:quercetin dioxygenase-like cupin family protein [Streptomyces sp. LBL]|uniref:cupin domain-containing protein n=1 Tax=Streptomyces sp. LBL TaxID=2940562 RepID=UPI002473B991|nr:AraC family ligand binding domain-containing protein [Streptomyces sp. LBL]MDH6623096.1 quercetin dioxygenase-like cupin family protein [Streptomyces sp. LBL]